MKIIPVGAELFNADWNTKWTGRQTDRRTWGI